MKLITILFSIIILFCIINNNFFKKYIKNNIIETFFNNKNNIIVIGNAPIENKNLGHKMNKFDLVCRFNDFCLNDFELDIGNKIDFWVISSHFILLDYKRFLKKYNKLKNKKVFVVIPKVFNYNYNILKKKLPKYIFDNLNIIIENKDFVNNYNFGKKWGSTGLLFILYLIQNTDYKIFFNGFNHFTKEKLHYYENKTRLDTSKQIGHNSHIEKNIFELLLSNNKIYSFP